MPEIEGLQFNVTGESTKAQDSLQATIDKLEALSAKLAETKKSVSSLSKSLSGLGQNKGLSSFLSDLKKLTQSRSLSTFTKQLKNMQGEMNGIGQNIGAGIVQGIVSSSAQLSSVAREYIVNPVVEAVRSGFDVHSPSRVMAAIGKFLPAGLAKGIAENTREPVSAMLRVVQQVVTAAETAKAKIDKALDSGIGGEALYKGSAKTVEGVQSAFAKIKQAAKEFNRSGYSDSLGSTPLQGLHDAFNNLPKTAQSAFAKVKQQIKDFDSSGYKGLGDAPLQGLHDAFGSLPAVAQTAFAKVKLAERNFNRSGYTDSLTGTPLQGIHDAYINLPRAAQTAFGKVVAVAKSTKAGLGKAIDDGVGGEMLYKGATKAVEGAQVAFAKAKRVSDGFSKGLAKTATSAQSSFTKIRHAARDFSTNLGGYNGLGDAPLQGLHDAFSKLPKVAQSAFAKVKQSSRDALGVTGRGAAALGSRLKSVVVSTQDGKAGKPQLRDWTRLNALLGKVTANAGKAGAAMHRLAAAPVKKLLSPLDAAQEKLKHLKYAFATVLTYGTIYRVVGLFKTGLTDGLDNLYQYSLITGNQFAASMDRAATSLLFLKNSIAAAAAPLVNALAPALDFVVDKVVTLLNRFNQLVSALSGKTTYTKAVKQQTKYAEAVKDTSDAEDDAKKKADELKRSLTSFDEIHALDDNSNKDSSSNKKNDSGTEIPDYGGMFTEEKIDGGISDFAKNLKDTINKGDWQSLGKMLADKVNGAIDAIDWQGTGKKFGYGLNGIIQTSYYFLKYTDFAKIGSRFAQFLDMALAQVDFSKAGGLLVRKFTSLLDLIGGFLYGLNWGLVTKSITDFWTGFFDEWSAWLDEHDWTDIGEIFQRKLQQAIDNLDFGAIASSFWTAVSKSFRAAVDVNFGFYDKISDELNAIMELFGGAELALGAVLCFSGANIPLGLALMAFGAKNLIATAIVNWGSIETPVGKVLSTLQVILSGAALVVGSLLAFSGANIPLGIALMAAGAVNIASNAALNWDGCSDKVKTVISTITGIVGGALLAIGAIMCFSGVAMPIGITLMAAGAASLASSIALDWSKSAKGVQAAAGTIVSLAGKMSFAIGAILCFSGVGIPLGIALMAAGIGATVLGNSMNSQKGVDWGALGKKMVEVGEDVVLGFLKGLGWFVAHSPLEIAWTYIVKPLIDAVKKKLGIHSPSTVFADIGINTVKGLLNGILDGMKGIADWVKTNVTDPIVNKAKEGWEDAKTSTKTAWRDICDSVKTKGDEMSRKAEDAFAKAARAAKTKMEDMQNKVKNAIDKIKKFFDVTLGFKGIKLPSISVSWDTASAVGQALSKLGMPGVPNFHVNWNQYAKGGFPDEGELYVARENGSEMIGRMGNKNVVANNQQIIDGIARGVASANSQQNALLREQNELLRALLEKDTGISIGDITNAARRQNQRMGKTVIPVG